MKTLFLTLTLLFFATLVSAQQREFYQLKEYTLKPGDPEKTVDEYLKTAYLPALHRAGIRDIGVFKPIENTTDTLTSIYVLIPFSSLNQFLELDTKLAADKQYQQAAAPYLNAPAKKSPYLRIESTLMKAFADMPVHKTPSFSTEKSKRVYELRSYESPTEKLLDNKIDMFNAGGEINIFETLDFNAVFYGEVISGASMPNLMYMTTFSDMESRNDHWKSFSDFPEWKALLANPKYDRGNVSSHGIYLLYPTEYSDY